MPIVAGFKKAAHVVAAPALAGLLAQSPTYQKKLKNEQSTSGDSNCAGKPAQAR